MIKLHFTSPVNQFLHYTDKEVNLGLEEKFRKTPMSKALKLKAHLERRRLKQSLH